MIMHIINPRLRMLALDDFEDESIQNQEPVLIKKSIINYDPKVDYLLYKLPDGEGLHDEEEAKWLFNQLREKHRENELNLGYHGNLHEHIDYETIFYTCRVIAAGERDEISNLPDEEPCIKDFHKGSYRYWMWTLAQQMPIGIAKPEEMPMQDTDGIYPPEWFGYYNSIGPVIYLCPTRIKEAVEPLRKNGIHVDEKLLTAYVIIHLLAHAVLDASNRLDADGKLHKYDNKCQRVLTDDADILMEESIANMITLSYFDSFMKETKTSDAKMAFDTVKEYISIQPMPYKFGLTQYYLLHPDWRKIWHEHKHFF